MRKSLTAPHTAFRASCNVCGAFVMSESQPGTSVTHSAGELYALSRRIEHQANCPHRVQPRGFFVQTTFRGVSVEAPS